MRRELEMIVNENPAFTLAQINTALRQRLPQKPHISRTVLADTLEAALLHGHQEARILPSRAEQ